jgi:hypothetical protein
MGDDGEGAAMRHLGGNVVHDGFRASVRVRNSAGPYSTKYRFGKGC